MPFNLPILAQDDSGGTQIFYVIAVLILTVGSALFEKMRQKSAEAERKRRGTKPPIPPPVQSEADERRSPPPVARPPWSAPERPARPAPPPVPPRPTARPQPARPPKRRPQATPEPARQIKEPSRRIGSAVEQAVGRLEGQVGADIRDQPVLLQPAQSLAQIRSAQQAKATVAGQPVAFSKPTVAELRRAIVLNEILGQPIGLRERVEP